MTLYERVAPIVTSGLRFADWVQIFGGERPAAPSLDRLMHHAHILGFMGADSYRFWQRVQRMAHTVHRSTTTTRQVVPSAAARVDALAAKWVPLRLTRNIG
ncbi:MAG: ATP-binding protein [Anaerolineae bacterium]|nr:ATP-binding protein [Anaerolineae bacterium]